jgi:hypothetical protein
MLPKMAASAPCPPLPISLPGASELVVDAFALNPQTIERYFGITAGHIHHIDNTFGFADRFPHRTPVQVREAGGGLPRAVHHAAFVQNNEMRLEAVCLALCLVQAWR